MFIDSQELFASAQAVTATGDTASTNVLDTGAAQDEGIGEEVLLVVLCTTTPTSGGAATIQPVLQTSSDNATYTDAMTGPALAYTAITAGQTLFASRLPIGLKRYLRVVFRIGTAVLTAGNFSAFLVKDVQAYQFGASGFTVA
jgi:hypothetical protein